MCGIIGYIGKQQQAMEQALQSLTHRGHDMQELIEGKEPIPYAIGHVLHAMVGHVKQPLVHNQYIFVGNIELYNWKILAQHYSIDAQNDAQVAFALLQTLGMRAINVFDGDFAFAFYDGTSWYLARDCFGVKPLWYGTNGKELWFASEHHCFADMHLLDPTTYITYTNHVCSVTTWHTWQEQEVRQTQQDIVLHIESLFKQAVAKRSAYDKPIGVLFSGGIDSVLVAYTLKLLGKQVILYSAGLPQSHDVQAAMQAAKWLDMPLQIQYPKDDAFVIDALKKLKQMLGTSHYVALSVALPFYVALQQNTTRLVMSGLGSEELFAGYQRHVQSADINKECIAGLYALHTRDLYRDDVICMHAGAELRLPFLDKQLCQYALGIDANLKIVGEHKKYIIRKVAQHMGIPQDFAFRPKKAAQYGSGFDKLLEKLSGKMPKQEWVKSL
ncbi:MAG: asparagine synthetase B family protein [Candidatus Woesearchaeota archaeon]